MNDLEKKITKSNKIFKYFLPILSRFNVELKLETINDNTKPHFAMQDGVLTLNLALINELQIESVISYNIQQLILPSLYLETNRLIIRRIEKEDLHGFFEIASNSEIAIKDGFSPYKSLEDFKPVFNKFLTDNYRYSVTLKSEKRIIGIINFTKNEARAVTAFEIGCDVNQEYWRHGYAAEFVSAFLDFCLNDLSIDLITAGCFDGNNASMNLLKKLGFTFEGKLRLSCCHGIFGPTDLNSFYIEKPIFLNLKD